MTTVRDRWTDYSVGINELGQTDATFTKREWDLGSERFIGMKFSDLVPILLRESRFNLACFTPSKWIGNYQGGIVEAYFKIYKVNPHERSGQQRKTGGGQIDRWVSVPVDPRGKIYPGDRTGLDAKTQRRLTREVKRARHLALLPFVVRPL